MRQAWQCLVVVVEGVEEGEYDGIDKSGVQFSPDSKRVAYGAFRAGKWFAVIDGVKAKGYDGSNTVVFSPDSKRVAYLALRGNKSLVVVDGKEEHSMRQSVSVR